MIKSLSVWIAIIALWCMILNEGYFNIVVDQQIDKNIDQYLTQLKKNGELNKIFRNKRGLEI